MLTQALLAAPMFSARWRWNASRALAIPRFSGGRKVPPPIQRMRADDLLAAVFPGSGGLRGESDGRDPHSGSSAGERDHRQLPARGHGSERADGVILRALADGQIRTVAIDTPEPSPFSHEILNANPYAYLDDAPLEERRARAVQLRRTLAHGRGGRRGRAGSGGDRAGGRRILAGCSRCRRTARRAAHADPAAAGAGVAALVSNELRSRRGARVRIGDADSGWRPSGLQATRVRRLPWQRPARLAGLDRSGHGARHLAQQLSLPRDAIEIALAQLEARRPDPARALHAGLRAAKPNGATGASWRAFTG